MAVKTTKDGVTRKNIKDGGMNFSPDVLDKWSKLIKEGNVMMVMKEFEMMKKFMIESVNGMMDMVTAYKLRKSGVSPTTISRFKKSPEELGIETIIKLANDVSKVIQMEERITKK
jgi:hypothetical protein